ncbi:MAG: hypothetical protein H6Q17_137 [Bacteroidetes bacterium]|jgi:hypothetical protein|nr:hypothetical protein [Bacteroidota bacterium]
MIVSVSEQHILEIQNSDILQLTYHQLFMKMIVSKVTKCLDKQRVFMLY